MSQAAVNPLRERPGKSLGTAVALAFFFGPIGLFYASVTGALVMLAVCVVVLVPILLGLHINAVLYFPVWVVCILWAAVAAYERRARPAGAPAAHEEAQAGAPARGAHGLHDDGAPGRN